MPKFAASPKGLPLATAIFVLIWTLLCQAAFAAERVSITSAIGGAIYYSKDGWIAVGGVTMTQGDMQITSERMKFDADAELAVFTGNVRVRQAENTIEGAQFTYDLGTGTGTIEEAVASFEIEGFNSPIYLLGDILELGEAYGSVENARLTTCLPLSSPGYYLASRRIDVFPGDRMVIRNVRFVESGITLFYWPYVSISLKDESPSDIRLPEIGHNASDGWYVKTRYAYDGPGEGHGEVALDWFQNKGVGAGVHHTYRSGDRGEGSFTAYRLANRATGHDDLSLGWEEAFSLGSSLDATWRSAYVKERGDLGGEQHEGRYALAVDGSIAGHPGNIEWAAKRLWGDQTLSTDRLRLSHRGNVDGWRWRAQADAYYLRPSPERFAYAYGLNLRKTQGPYSLTVDLERRLHSRYFTENLGTPAWQLRTSLPSVLLSINLADALSARIPVDLDLSWGRFSEARRVGSEYPLVAADRSSVAFRLQPGTIRLGPLGNLYYRAGIEYQSYSNESRRLILSANHQYRLPLGRSWLLYGGYAYEEAFGDPSPFSFDQVSAYERVTGRLQYSFARGSAFVSTGYDFHTATLSDLVGQLSYRPASGGLLALQGGYSLVEARPTYLAANVSFNPSSNFSVNASTRYDFNSRTFDTLSAGLTAAYLGWKVDYEAAFDLDENGGMSTDIAVLRDLGCREIGLRYSSDAGSVWLEYRITALPGSGLRFGATRDRFMVDPEGLSSLF